MKRLLALLLAALLLMGALPALAEKDAALLESDAYRARWGIALTAEMIAATHDCLQDLEDEAVRRWVKTFWNIPLMAPDKVIVIDLTDAQTEAARQALGAETKADIAPALARYLNVQFSKEYAQAADLVAATHFDHDMRYGLVILPYGNAVAIMSAWGEYAKGGLIISTKENSAALSAADISQYALVLGLSGLDIRVYEGEACDSLLALADWKYWDQPATCLQQAVASGDKQFSQMYPLLLRQNVTSGLQFSTLGRYLAQTAAYNHNRMWMIRTAWVPKINVGDSNWKTLFLTNNNILTACAAAAPAITYGDVLEEAEADPQGTFLFVAESHRPGEEAVSWCDLTLEVLLLPHCLPQSVDQADYIIHLDITWSDTPDISQGGANLYYPLTHITVHDARTGALIKDLGTVTRSLRGVVRLPVGDTYWTPYREAIWSKVRGVVGE